MSKNLRKTGLLSFLWILCLLMSGYTIYAQRNIIDNNLLTNRKPTFSSPNAAALGKFTEFPTASYNGVPDIGFPFFKLNIKGVELPVGISYHASGIKVDDIASDVGMGWSINYGGSINVMVNGLADELSEFPMINTSDYQKIKTGGFQNYYNSVVINCFTANVYKDPMGPHPYGLYSGGDIDFLRNVMLGNGDSEPDIYMFSFAGRSGKFVQDEFGVYRSIPASDLKMERIVENSLPQGYKITDETGAIYEFRGKEESEDIIQDPSDMSGSVSKKSLTYNLTKITNLFGESINFYYSYYSNTSYQTQKSFSRARFPSGVIGSSCWQMNGAGSYYYNSFTSTFKSVSPVRIDSIVSSDGSLVVFNYDNNFRTDFNGTKALSSVELWSINNERRKVGAYSLTHDYSIGGNRLSLSGIIKDSEPSTSFIYDNWLPPYLSYSQDHYGYYNGKNNYTLLPLDEYHEFYEGADRSVLPSFTQGGVLKSVVHPTGGRTDYIYENNEYYVDHPTTVQNKVVGASRVSVPDQTTSISFTVPSNASNIRIVFTNTYDGTVMHNDYCIIHLTGNGYSQDFLGNSNLNMPYLNLTPGQYTLSIENVGTTYSAEATITWFESAVIPAHNELGGGLRIREIRKLDKENSVVYSQKYEYSLEGTTNSSGINLMAPEYIGYKDQTGNKEGDINTNYNCTSTYCQFLTQQSNSAAPLGFSNGSSVLYKEVVSYVTDKTKTGYTQYKFNVSKSGTSHLVSDFPFAPPVFYDWVNGSLIEKNEWAYNPGNSSFRKVKTVKQIYNYADFDPAVNTGGVYTVYGSKIAAKDPPFICSSVCSGTNVLGTTTSSISFGIKPYRLYSAPYHLNRTEETTFDDQNAAKTIYTYYFYDNPLSTQLSRKEVVTSSGERIVETNRYSTDLENFGFVQYLRSKNVVGIPIESIVSKKDISGNQSVLSGQVGSFYSNSFQLQNVYTLELKSPIAVSNFNNTTITTTGLLLLDTRYKLQSSAFGYNSVGNLTELQSPAGEKGSFIWDYLGVKPIAEIKNAGLSDIAYTSFEADGKGSWLFNESQVTSEEGGITGKKSFDLNVNFPISRSGLNPVKLYRLSYWTKNAAAFTIAGTTAGYPVSGRVVAGWKYFEHLITGVNMVNVSGSGKIDELRLCPVDAAMTTYTYDHLTGITSTCDQANHITYYEYDNSNRLILVRDHDKNILKRICYNYWGQVSNCGTEVPACTNTLPDWQNTASAVRCQVNSCGNTGYQEQEQRDMNICSPTYNSVRWVTAAYNTTACQLNSVTIGYSNTISPGFSSGYTAVYTNGPLSYTFNIPASGSGTLGCIPAGTYTLTISKAGSTWQVLFSPGCKFAVSGTSSVTFSKLGVSSSACNTISLQNDAVE